MGTIRPLRLFPKIGCDVILGCTLNSLDPFPKLNALDGFGEAGFTVALRTFFLADIMSVEIMTRAGLWFRRVFILRLRLTSTCRGVTLRGSVIVRDALWHTNRGVADNANVVPKNSC